MRTIWKWKLFENTTWDERDRPLIKMPFGARVLTVQMQDDQPCVWAEVDDDAMLVERRFVIVGTGTEKPRDALRYLGTWQQSGFVFHLYEAP